jgi:ribosomal protein S18 acetylase RimI-like enzyme
MTMPDDSITSIDRLQEYLRWSAQRLYETVHVPPFTFFFHPRDDLTYFNYAIPDNAVAGDISAPIARLRSEFDARRRTPRFEFVEGFAPDLPAALQGEGFVEESRLHLMTCTPDTFRPAPPVPGLSILRLTRNADEEDLAAFLSTQRRGFEGDESAMPTQSDMEALRSRLDGGGGTFLARLDGESVAAGVFSTPSSGLTEVAGIATLERFRRLGIASALTAEAVRIAFDEGVEIAVLSAADARAGRVYERVGFQPHATMLAYIEGRGTKSER